MQRSLNPTQVGYQVGNDFLGGQSQDLVTGYERVTDKIGVPCRIDFHLANCEGWVRFDEGMYLGVDYEGAAFAVNMSNDQVFRSPALGEHDFQVYDSARLELSSY